MLEWLFSKVYWWRLIDHMGRKIRVDKVKGWRTARMTSKGGTTQTGTFLFKIWKWYI